MSSEKESSKNNSSSLRLIEKRLSESDEIYKMLVEGIHDFGLIMLSPDGYILSWNSGAEKITGFKSGEAVGKHMNILYSKNSSDTSFISSELHEISKHGRIETEGLRIRRDGSEFVAGITMNAIYDERHKLIGISYLLSDITKKKHEDSLLQKSEERYKRMIQGIKDYAIFLISPEGNIESWNEGAHRIKGYTEKEILGKNFSIFYPKETVDSGYPKYELEQAKKKGRFEDEGIRIRKDGSTFYAHVIITAIYNKDKKLIGFSKVTRDLTEKKEAEEQLRKSEEKYRLLIEGVKDYAIYMLSTSGVIESWNEGAQRLKGYNEDEVLGKHFSLFYPAEAVQRRFPDFELEQAKKRGRFEDEGYRIRKDGSIFYANAIITAIYNKDKELIGFSKITRDLTEKKEAEELLRKSEEKYRLLIEGVKDYAIYMLDTEGRVVSWNEGAKRLIRYDEKEILGSHFSIFYPKEQKDSGFPNFELECARKNGRFEDEGFRVRKDGTTFYVNVVITPIYNKEKNLIGYSKITRDLSERKEAEELLRRSEQRYRSLIEGVKDYAIFMLDPEGYIASWNEGAKRLKRYDESEIIGKHFSIFYPEEKIRSKFPEYELEQAKLYGKFEDEGIRIRKDGTTFYANVIITAIYDNNNQIIGFSKITRDLTERKLAEDKLSSLNIELENKVKERTEELSKTVNELKAINSDLDNFIYTASHDLKAPVSNIEGLINTLTDTLNESNHSKQEINELLEMIKKSVLRFQSTIKDLTSINESQKSDKNDLISIQLRDIIEDVTSSVDHLIKESKAEITVETEESPSFKFSKIHIRSIVYNLLTNAIKYRSPKRPLKINVRSYISGSKHYVIEVSDNGLGIGTEHKDKIFQMFKRLHDHVEGSGIGLYILRKIVDNAGGKIEVDSAPDHGTTFRIFLPIK